MNLVVPESLAVAPVTAALRVRECDSRDEQRWSDYVDAHADATFFHRFGWRRVIERAFGHRAHYLIAERDGRLCGILPLVHQRSLLFGSALISLPFCVYGGVVADDDEGRDALLDAAMAHANELGAAYLEVRNTCRTREDWPVKDLYVTFRKAISGDDEQNLAAVPRKQRAMIRKGQKAGLETRVDTNIEPFFSLYAESVRNLGTPVFPRRYFELLRAEFSDDVEVVVIEHQGTPVSAVMSFYFRDQVLPYYGGGTAQARAVKANDFMYWAVMQRAAARGVRVFDYGRSKQGTGSYRFKKHWGFEPEPLYYEYGLVGADTMPDLSPANPKYRLAIAVWKRLPLPVAKWVGPYFARHLG